MLDQLITSKTRVKLLLKFFTNPDTKSYLRGLADEFGESTNGIRIELNRLTKAGFLEVNSNGKSKLYKANTSHPLFPEIHSLVKKYLGIDKIIDNILAQLGTVEMAFVTGNYAKGIDSGIIDLIVVGLIDMNYFVNLIDNVEKLIKRKIRYLILSNDEFIKLKDTLNIDKSLVVWEEVKEE